MVEAHPEAEEMANLFVKLLPFLKDSSFCDSSLFRLSVIIMDMDTGYRPRLPSGGAIFVTLPDMFYVLEIVSSLHSLRQEYINRIILNRNFGHCDDELDLFSVLCMPLSQFKHHFIILCFSIYGAIYVVIVCHSAVYIFRFRTVKLSF